MCLLVLDAPTCKQDRILVVGASRSENLDIVCEVDADPPARSFRWKFNNSGETLNVGPERYSANGTASALRYTPVADLDYGTLSCWADNSIGTQASPCLFQVVAAGEYIITILINCKPTSVICPVVLYLTACCGVRLS